MLQNHWESFKASLDQVMSVDTPPYLTVCIDPMYTYMLVHTHTHSFKAQKTEAKQVSNLVIIQKSSVLKSQKEEEMLFK